MILSSYVTIWHNLFIEFSAQLNFKLEKDTFSNCRFNEMQVEEHFFLNKSRRTLENITT
jgi:hypothetical protein